eukprot:PhF_6_TR42166/c0_g2_i1/m.63737
MDTRPNKFKGGYPTHRTSERPNKRSPMEPHAVALLQSLRALTKGSTRSPDLQCRTEVLERIRNTEEEFSNSPGLKIPPKFTDGMSPPRTSVSPRRSVSPQPIHLTTSPSGAKFVIRPDQPLPVHFDPYNAEARKERLKNVLSRAKESPEQRVERKKRELLSRQEVPRPPARTVSKNHVPSCAYSQIASQQPRTKAIELETIRQRRISLRSTIHDTDLLHSILPTLTAHNGDTQNQPPPSEAEFTQPQQENVKPPPPEDPKLLEPRTPQQDEPIQPQSQPEPVNPPPQQESVNQEPEPVQQQDESAPQQEQDPTPVKEQDEVKQEQEATQPPQQRQDPAPQQQEDPTPAPQQEPAQVKEQDAAQPQEPTPAPQQQEPAPVKEQEATQPPQQEPAPTPQQQEEPVPAPQQQEPVLAQQQQEEPA